MLGAEKWRVCMNSVSERNCYFPKADNQKQWYKYKDKNNRKWSFALNNFRHIKSYKEFKKHCKENDNYCNSAGNNGRFLKNLLQNIIAHQK